jgi:hypothetical protein
MTTKSRRTSLVPIAVALSAALLLSACYTLMQHPRLAQLDYARPSDKRCLNCHAEADLRRLVIAHQHSSSRDPWRSYYDEPWWFNDYLRSDSTTSDDEASEGTTGNGKAGQ